VGRRRRGCDTTGTQIVPEEAAVVREVFTRHPHGDSPVRRARDPLRPRREDSRGRNRSAPRVRDLLGDCHVTGIRVCADDEIGDGEVSA
jgi:hypothetical protein